jgi:hypothetical protein
MTDVSFWQESNRAYPPIIPMDWQKAKDQGVQGAYIKASEGVSSDPAMPNHHRFAGAQNIKRGAYHFYRDYISGANQGIQFLANIVGLNWELPPAIDVEVICDSKQIWELASYIHTHMGVWPIIYTSPDVWNNRMVDTKIWVGLRYVSCKLLLAEKCDIWQAQYPDAEYDTGSVVMPLSPLKYYADLGKRVIIHQYSVKNAMGKLYGSQGSISIDLDLADSEWFDKYPRPHTLPLPEPEPIPSTPTGLDQSFRCLVDGQNVRMAPVSTSIISGKLMAGQILSYPTEIAVNNRYEVWLKFSIGWVATVHGGTQYLSSIKKD